MGFLDNLKDKAEDFGEKAKEGFEAAKDKASDLVGDVKERLDNDDDHGTDPAGPAADRSPADVGNPSYGLDDAAAESTLADSTAVGEPVEPVGVTEDPLEPAPEVEPAQPAADTEDPLEPTPDRIA